MAGQELRVLFEDPALIIVDKPAGIHTAPLRPGETGTLIDLVHRLLSRGGWRSRGSSRWNRGSCIAWTGTRPGSS